VLWAVIKFGFQRAWQKKLSTESRVFEVISDPAVLRPKLSATEDDKTPLADHRIPYQPRAPGRDIQVELKAALRRSRYLLVTAPTGYGKTRKAGMLAQTLMLEGCTGLILRYWSWKKSASTPPLPLPRPR